MTEDVPPTPEDAKQAARARKAARRVKQRAANLGRAEKMRKARLAEPVECVLLKTQPQAVHVGCSGWFYWHWRTKFYPAEMPTKDWFGYYRESFSTVELNASFYSWPTVNTVKTWRSQAEGGNFIYTVKVNELITHIRSFVDVGELIRDFSYIADLLGPHMGCFLFQFPSSFRFSPERLEAIVSQLDHSRRNVVEFRHKSWWNETVYAAFRRYGTIFCTLSAPGLPDDMIRTADDLYVRFHGIEKWYHHLYSEIDMQTWAQRSAQTGAPRVWAYFNNDFETHAITNARQLQASLTASILANDGVL